MKIKVNRNGTFRSKILRTIGDAAGEKGRARIRGTIKGRRVTGTVTARTTGNALGPCKGKGRFKGTGEQIG